MAAHAVDELIEAIEMEEKPEARETAKDFEHGDAENKTKSAYMPPPPPPVTQNAYKQVRKVISFFPRRFLCCVGVKGG